MRKDRFECHKEDYSLWPPKNIMNKYCSQYDLKILLKTDSFSYRIHDCEVIWTIDIVKAWEICNALCYTSKIILRRKTPYNVQY